MKTFRENPEGPENTDATKQNEREVFALKMEAKAMNQPVRLENLKLEECHETGVFNASYFISADDPSPYRKSDEDGIIICRFPTGCGAYSEQKPIAEFVLRTISNHEALVGALTRLLEASTSLHAPAIMGAVDNAVAVLRKINS